MVLRAEEGVVDLSGVEEEGEGEFGSFSSERVFQFLHAGHCPDHLGNSLPQEEQRNIEDDLDMS